MRYNWTLKLTWSIAVQVYQAIFAAIAGEYW